MAWEAAECHPLWEHWTKNEQDIKKQKNNQIMKIITHTLEKLNNFKKTNKYI